MILEKQKEANILVDGEINESIGMSLDLDSAQILMQMLSKNLYSDGIGSTIRECASNALDSHRRVGIEDPIIVSLELDNSNNYQFSVEDFGIGLDADDVRNIISKYGKSTKRNSNTELGMMGLGFKAPLAYSSSFYFICRKDGIERKYMMYEGEDTNTIDLLYEIPTTDRNGVKVIVPVKYSDRSSFYEKIKEQLAYFENAYFNVTLNDRSINNEFTIHRSENFQYSEICKNENMHISLDNVYYPIDFDKLGIPIVQFPIALRFSLTDGLFPTPNRESIRYTTEAKAAILDKIKLLSDYFIHKYNERSKNCNTYSQVYDYYNSERRYVEIIPNVRLNVGYLSTFSDVTIVKPTLKNVKYLDLKKLVDNHNSILGEYSNMFSLNLGKIRDLKSKSSWESIVTNFIDKGDKLYIYSDKLPEVKKAYLRETLPGGYSNKYFFLKKVKSYKLFPKKNQISSYDNYYTLLRLSSIDKSHWREAILEFQGIVKDIISTFIDLDAIVVPDSFIQSRKKVGVRSSTDRKKKLTGEISLKVAQNLERYVSGKSCKFVATTANLNDLSKNGKFIIYAHHDDSDKLDKLYNTNNNRLVKMMFVTLSSRELRVLESMEFKNTISYSKFMEGSNKPFKRIVTAFLITSLYSNNVRLFSKIKLVKNISVDIHNKILELDTYRIKNDYHCYSDIMIEMTKTSKSNNLFDMTIYPEYLRMVKILDDLYFLTGLVGQMSTWIASESNVVYVKMIVDLMKYNKYKVNLDHYSSPKVEELVDEVA